MQFEKWIPVDLMKSPFHVLDIGIPVCTGDNNSVRLGVQVTSNGAPVDVTGAIKGIITLPNGLGIMPFDGAKDGNRAWIDLPEDALGMAGRITVAIRSFDGGETTVLLLASATVRRVDADQYYDPSDIVGDITDLIEDAEQAAQDAEAALAQATAVVSYAAQTGKTDAQKAQARANISAASTGDVSDLQSALGWKTSFDSNGANHPATSDQAAVSIKQGTVFFTKATINKSVGFTVYAYYSDGTNESIHTGKANALYQLVASKDITAIGVYVGPQSESYSLSLSIAADKSPMMHEIADTESAIKNESKLNDAGVQSFWPYARFANGGLKTSGLFEYTQPYRVSCIEHITIIDALTVHVKSGYRWGYIPFVNGSAGSWVGWKTSDFTIPANTEFVVQIAKVTEDTSSVSDIIELVSAVTFDTTSGEAKADVENVEDCLDGSGYIEVEIGSMSAGKPSTSTAYVRSKDFIKAHKGDVLTLAPKAFGLYYGVIYVYNTNDEQGYDESAGTSIPTVSANSTWSHTFSDDCWFKFRACNASSGANIKPEDLYLFNDVFHIEHIYDADELTDQQNGYVLDYAAMNTSLAGTFNIALQTDTHMSDFVGYTASMQKRSDFNKLLAVVRTVNQLDIDMFTNLGDFIRGYQCDPGYESRANADKMMGIYGQIRTNKAFVIGNHDDGSLFHSNTDYNDNPTTTDVMFPGEQFNRYTKYGLNQAGIKNYYYADIGGVRIITLYQRDFDYSDTVPQIEAFKIGAEQISWLTNTALDTDLPVIVLTHAPLLASLYATSRTGFDDVLTALTSFVSGGGTVIAVLSGHTHAQNSATVDGINHIVFKNGYDFFELISVDLTGHTITCKAINNSSLSEMNFTF